jgi:hypothetical protein
MHFFRMRGQRMKYALLIPFIAAVLGVNSLAEERIYRCANNEYTNTEPSALARGCKLMSGGNVTVVQSTRPVASTATRTTPAATGGQRVEPGDQKARDSDARQILEAELKKALARQAELAKEYNNGAPEQQGIESRNHQKYLDRVAELKASLARVESDIAGIRRELGRLPAPTAAK